MIKNDLKTARTILETSLKAVNDSPSGYYFFEVKELIKEIIENVQSSNDFYLELGSREVRIIDSDHIDEIWSDELIEPLKDSDKLSNLPPFIAIDWEKTAENYKVEGMGHHFAWYDGEEWETETHYIFRTN